jgi:hypothetical protein
VGNKPDWEVVERDGRTVNSEPELVVTKTREFYITFGLRKLLGDAFKILRDQNSGGFALCPCKVEEIGKKGYRIGTNPHFSNKNMRDALDVQPGERLAVRKMDNLYALIRRVEV